MGGGGQGCRDQPICRMPARTSTNHKRPLFVEESVPHSMHPEERGAAVLWGSLSSIAWTRTTPSPLFLLK